MLSIKAIVALVIAISAAAVKAGAALPMVRDDTEPTFMYGTQTGDGTYYNVGLGVCGVTSTDGDLVVAVSELLFDNYPGYSGNPESNPVCGQSITASYQGHSVTVVVTDADAELQLTDLDFSPAAFEQLADLSVGRINDLTWVWA